MEARWELANYHYKRKNYSHCAEEFNRASASGSLSKPRRDEYRFKLGHCYFEREEYEKARVPALRSARSRRRFSICRAVLLLAHRLPEGAAPGGLDGFEKIANDPDFQELVPLYITQFYHALGQWDRLKEYAHHCWMNPVASTMKAWPRWRTCSAMRGTVTKHTTRRRLTSNWLGTAQTAQVATPSSPTRWATRATALKTGAEPWTACPCDVRRR